MRWVLIGKAYFNMEHIQAFRLSWRKLYIYRWDGSEEVYDDPTGEQYRRMCVAAGVRPLEVGSNGKDRV
jgi:hypothetical protein